MSKFNSTKSYTDSSTCRDFMRYALFDLLQVPLNQSIHVRKRQHYYRNVFKLANHNINSSVKCENLYVILYSRYYTTRFMAEERAWKLNINISHQLDNDEIIKAQFKALTNDRNALTSDIAFEKKYMSIIATLNDAATLPLYEEMNKKIINHAKLDSDDIELFYLGTSATDIYMHRKLIEDSKKFWSNSERVKNFIKDWTFLNGFLFTSAIVGFGSVYTWFFHKWTPSPTKHISQSK